MEKVTKQQPSEVGEPINAADILDAQKQTEHLSNPFQIATCMAQVLNKRLRKLLAALGSGQELREAAGRVLNEVELNKVLLRTDQFSRDLELLARAALPLPLAPKMSAEGGK